MLRLTLRLNALSCFLFGFIFSVFQTTIANYLGTSKTFLLQCVGILLLLNSVHLLFSSFRSELQKKEILYFSVGDFLWVLFTFLLIFSQFLITTPHGIIAALIVAFTVGSFGLLQAKGASQLSAFS